METIRCVLISCILIFFVADLSAQDNRNRPFECSENEVKICPDTIMGKSEYLQLQHDTADLKKQIADLTAQLKKPDIDKFLNIQDTSIFGSNFQRFLLEIILARSLDFYLLIENIHDLNILLENMGNITVTQLRQNLKNKLEVAKAKIDLINSFTTNEKRRVSDFLTESQKQHYRQLVDRYNELNGMFNFNSNESGNEN